MKYMN